MSNLIVCPACNRHVRQHELICPFCQKARAEARPVSLLVHRATRAALFLGVAVTAAGCGGTQTPDPQPTNQSEAHTTSTVDVVEPTNTQTTTQAAVDVPVAPVTADAATTTTTPHGPVVHPVAPSVRYGMPPRVSELT